MLLEMMKKGPMKYCIVGNTMPNFSSKVMLLLKYLPPKKICIYPPYMLNGPFNRSLWREIGEAIRERRINLKNPMLRTIFYTQQYLVFMKTGVYGITYWL